MFNDWVYHFMGYVTNKIKRFIMLMQYDFIFLKDKNRS